MKKLKKRYCLFLVGLCTIICALFTTCSKIPEGRLPDGYIALTFDDFSVENWYENLSLLESLGIKATFYVSNYHQLSATDKQRLKEIRSRGHEIGYHTTNHKNLVKLLYSSSDGLNKVYEEINADLNLMRNDGFVLTDFAYPFGRHDATLDRELLKIFKTVRAVTNKTNFYQSLVTDAGCEKQVLFAAHVDIRTFLTDGDMYNLLIKAKDKKACAVLFAHQINLAGSKYQIDTDKLRRIADIAKELNLQFITIDQLH